MRRFRTAVSPAGALLGLTVAAGLALRLWHNGYGLPYVFNEDEGSHFTSRAVGMFGHDANPGYFQNPSAFTYLIYATLRVVFSGLFPPGGSRDLVQLFREDPSSIYLITRSLAAVVCMLGVVAVFVVAKRLWGAWEGLVAAALLSFSFLAVAYSRIAVTDVGTLLPVTFAIYGAVRVQETGDRRWYVLAGATSGLATGFKYTAGLVILTVLLAAALRVRPDGIRRSITGLLIALGSAVVVFFITTPFFFLDFETARRQIEAQAQIASGVPKLGQGQGSGLLYYLDSLTWGLGWVTIIAAVAGAILLFLSNRGRALVLVVLPVAMLLYLGFQSRYFGRWFLPAYPALVMLAGVAIVRASALVRGSPGLRAAALGAIVVLALVQPLAADVRTARLLGRADTRELAREYLRLHYPSQLRAVIEPAVPARFYRLSRPGNKAQLSRKQFVRGFVRDIKESRIDYAATLHPEMIDRYRELGFCVVVTMSVIRGRATNDDVPDALAYYRRLERESRTVASFSPYRKGASAPPFHFDLSYNYYPTAFERPGPLVKIYDLDECRQQRGPVRRGVGTPRVSTS